MRASTATRNIIKSSLGITTRSGQSAPLFRPVLVPQLGINSSSFVRQFFHLRSRVHSLPTFSIRTIRNSSNYNAPPLTDAPETPPDPPTDRQVPAKILTFTCKPCKTRSAHQISDHGYKYGSILITCPSCKARHVIVDHLKIFGDKARSLEQIAKEAGEVIQRGNVANEDGDVEFWKDGSAAVSQGAILGRIGESEQEEK